MHPIIQAEVDEFDGNFMNNGVDGILRDEFQDTRMLIIRKHFSAALHRAVEKAGKEMVMPEVKGNIGGRGKGINESREFSLSKLDTIINFKE